MHAKCFTSMYRFFESICIKNATGRRADCLKKEMEDALKKVKIFAVVSVLCFAIFALYPIYAYVNENRLVPIARMEFPCLDQTKMKGYLIGLTIMLIFACLAILGSLAFDSLILLILLIIGSLVTQLSNDLNNYHEMWENKETFSAQQREYFLRNICMKYEDINR